MWGEKRGKEERELGGYSISEKTVKWADNKEKGRDREGGKEAGEQEGGNDGGGWIGRWGR